eukprot:954052-Pyramimonas_sp.AAC.1
MSAGQVIHAIMLTASLHGASHLKRVLKNVISIVLPGSLGEPLLEALRGGAGVPARQTGGTRCDAGAPRCGQCGRIHTIRCKPAAGRGLADHRVVPMPGCTQDL